MWNPNDIIDDTYMIMNELGRGGTGVIYLAYHLRLEKYVVLKRIKDNFTNILKVRKEVDILKKLRHQYLPQVYDFMQVGQSIYTVIDYIDGCDLDNYLKTGYTFTEEQLVLWLRQLCNVLEYLHSQKPQILHCDIKPGNIMITSEGNVCLIDFNVSLDEESKTELAGISQYYASPEQYEKAMSMLYNTRTTAVIDQRTDIYSLGATFYHLITGILPTVTVGNVPLTKMQSSYYSMEFLEIIDKMMDPDPRTRYHKVSDVLAALDRAYNINKANKKIAVGLVSSAVAWVAAMAVGIGLCIHGNELLAIEGYNSDFSSFEELFNTGDYEETIDIGMDILNNTRYSKLFDNKKESKASVLRGIGECYFNVEEYGEAAKYYKQAIDCLGAGSAEPELIRDHAVALVRLGNVEEAENFLDSNKSDGLSDDDLSLVRGEIHALNGEYEKAVLLAEPLTKGPDNEMASHALILLANSYESMESYDEQIECLESLVKKDSSMLNMRMLGDAYIKYGEKQNQNNISKRNNCYKNAKKYYEQIVDNKYATKNDKMNLSVVYMALEEYDKAVSTLKDVYEDNKDDYKVNMYLAFVYDMMGDRSNARTYCQKAVSLYENAPKNNKESATSDNIISLYELEKKLR